MSRTLTEAKVLKKLDIPDFRHLTKEKAITMATMLDKMDPDVAKKALEQFPEFSQTMSQLFSEYKQLLDEGLKTNGESVQSFYTTCDEIISACQKLLEKDDLTFDERRFLLEQMVMVAQMKDSKDSENKHFIVALWGIGLAGLGLAVTALVTPLGSNIKIDMDSFKKLMK